jgi:peroxiredoxin
VLAPGDTAPLDVSVWTTPRERATIGQLLEGGPILLVFYLFDWSSTWTSELELLRDRSEELAAAGVQPYAISRDSAYTHVAWTQALDLTFPLLSDWNAEATHGFGVAYDHNGMRDVSARTAFLLDGEGVVREAWAYETSELPDVGVWIEAARGLSSSAWSPLLPRHGDTTDRRSACGS